MFSYLLSIRVFYCCHYISTGFGGCRRLLRSVGLSRAKKLIYLGEPMSAQEALKEGIVEELVEAKRLILRAKEIALKLLEASPHALNLSKKLLLAYSEKSASEVQKIESSLFFDAMAHPDSREGMNAFIEKRPPKWNKKIFYRKTV